MKKTYGLVVLMILLAFAIPAIPVVAEETMSTDQTTTETQNNYEIDEDPKSADYQKRLEERLAKRKATTEERLTNAQQKRIQAKCKAAQAAISKVSENAKLARTTREGVYDKIVDHAKSISAKLKEHQKDTAALDKNIEELEVLVVSFKTDMQTLRQAASDISNMDCATDPSSFQSTLEVLRTARKTLVDDAVAIRGYVKDSLKVTLTEIQGSLTQAKKEEGAN